MLVLTTTRRSAVTLQAHFRTKGKQANAETAVKVAGATAQHCIVLHGRTIFLSGNGHEADFDSECYTRANVAYSRATDLTILACPVNMQGIPGALQVLAALLHGVYTIHTGDSQKLQAAGHFDMEATFVSDATAAFAEALLPHQMWTGPLPVCLVEYCNGKARRLRLVLASQSLLYDAEISYMPNGAHFRGLLFGYAPDACMTPAWIVLPDSQHTGTWRLLHNCKDRAVDSASAAQRYQPAHGETTCTKVQDYRFEALRKIYFYDAWRLEPILDLRV